MFAWCHACPDSAPAFLAEIIPVLADGEVDVQERSLHPVITRLLDEFGDRKEVLQAIESNINTFGWVGSKTTYYAPYKVPLGKLLQHPNSDVRSWAKKMRRKLDEAVANARNEDEGRAALGEI